jgi:N-formylglutamate deformylase
MVPRKDSLSVMLSPSPFEVFVPSKEGLQLPVIVDLPHSGAIFPASFGHETEDLNVAPLEDICPDIFSTNALKLGICLVKANAVRSYIDCDQDAFVIDPRKFLIAKSILDSIASKDDLTSALQLANDDERLTDGRKISVVDGRNRLSRYYFPYREELRRQVTFLGKKFYVVTHLNFNASLPNQKADICISNDDGNSADDQLVAAIQSVARKFGLSVKTGGKLSIGSIVWEIGDPLHGVHSIAISLRNDTFAKDATQGSLFAEALVHSAAEFARAYRRGETDF